MPCQAYIQQAIAPSMEGEIVDSNGVNDDTGMQRRMASATWLAPLLTALVSLALYVATLTPEVDWSDSAELALQAYQLGVTHPPGYPVHTFLGKLLSFLMDEPAVATNLLSALGASTAAGLLALITVRLTGKWLFGPVAGLFFAFVPQIWGLAVVTEVYTVSAAFFALALALVLAYERSSRRALPIAAGFALALCLGSYLGNLLAIPGLLWLLWRARRDRVRPALLFLVTGAVATSLLLSWSFFRSSALPPIGTRYVPDSPRSFLQYLSAAQYGAAETLDPAFYWHRLAQHVPLFFTSFTWIGISLGLVGLVHQWRSDRPVCIGFLLLFGANFLYFTGYAATDYQTMVAISYLVFAPWVAYGVACLARFSVTLPRRLLGAGQLLLLALGGGLGFASAGADWFGFGDPGFGLAQLIGVVAGLALAAVGLALRRPRFTGWAGRNTGAIVGVALSTAALALILYPQLRPRLERTRSEYVTTFVYYSYDEFPAGALVAASWDKFAPLYYFQQVHGARDDLTIVERTLGSAGRPRTYHFGSVDDWRQLVLDTVDSRAVFVDCEDALLQEGVDFEPVPHGWYRVSAASHPVGE
jgi:hypothetical protein